MLGGKGEMSMSELSNTSQNDDGIDIRELLNIARRRFWVFLATAAVVFVAATLYTSQQTAYYTATSNILLNVRQSQIIDIEAVVSGLSGDASAVSTEVEVLRSRSLAENVVDRLDLVNVPELNPFLREPEGVDAFRNSVRDTLRSLLPGQVSARNTATEPDPEVVREVVVNAVLSRGAVERVRGTYILAVSFTAQAPALARDVANAYADAYLETQLEAKFEATERANAWLSERVDALRTEVRTHEQAVARFREEQNLINADGSTLAEQQVADINNQLAVQRAELTEARSRLDSVRAQLDRGVSPDTIGAIINSEVIQALRIQRSEISSRLAELSSRYGPRHPQIVTANRELADIEAQLDDGIARILSNLQNEVDGAQERVRSLEQSLRSARGELAENNAAIVRLRELEREAEAARALFESFLTRFRQTNEAESLTEADARLIAEAPLPRSPSGPNHTRNLLIGLVLAGIAGVGVVAILELLDGGLRTETDIERHFALPHVASIPRVQPGLIGRLSRRRAEPAGYLLDKPMSGFAESFRTIRSAIRLSGLDRPTKVVAITSALPGDGKTTTTLCLGRVSAMAGSSTIVVDCDLRRRLLTKGVLDGDPEAGLLELLSGSADVAATVRRDEKTDLDVLPLAQTTFTPRDVFGSQAFETLLQQLRERYDLVLLDTPPVLAVSDTRAIASLADRVIIAARWKKSGVGIVRKAINELRASKADILGVVLNNVNIEAQARYGYDVGGDYYRSYRNYYTD